MSYEEDSSSYSPSSSSSSEERVSKKRDLPKEDPQVAELDELRETQKDIREVLQKLEDLQRKSEKWTETLIRLRQTEKAILSRVVPVQKKKVRLKKNTSHSIFDQQAGGSTSSMAERFNDYVQQEYNREVGTHSFFGKPQ